MTQAHAAYYNTTHFEGLLAHREEPVTAESTGVTAGDRSKAAGLPNILIAEVMSYHNSTTREAIDSWLNTAYHRKIILDDSYPYDGM